jgi:hypothetical protein
MLESLALLNCPWIVAGCVYSLKEQVLLVRHTLLDIVYVSNCRVQDIAEQETECLGDKLRRPPQLPSVKQFARML